MLVRVSLKADSGKSGCSLDESSNPDQNDRSQDGDEDAPDQAASAQAEQSHDPSANDAADDSQHNVGDHAIAAAFHDLSGCPAGDQTNDDPPDKPLCHVILLEL